MEVFKMLDMRDTVSNPVKSQTSTPFLLTQDYMIKKSIKYQQAMQIYNKQNDLLQAQQTIKQVEARPVLIITAIALAHARTKVGMDAEPETVLKAVAAAQGIPQSHFSKIRALSPKFAKRLFKMLKTEVYGQSSYSHLHEDAIFLVDDTRVASQLNLFYREFMLVHEVAHIVDFRFSKIINSTIEQSTSVTCFRHQQEAFAEAMAFVWFAVKYGFSFAQAFFAKVRFSFVTCALPSLSGEIDYFHSKGNVNRGIYCSMPVIDALVRSFDQAELQPCPLIFSSLVGSVLNQNLLSLEEIKAVTGENLPSKITQSPLYSMMLKEHELRRQEIGEKQKYSEIDIPDFVKQVACPAAAYRELWCCETYFHSVGMRYNAERQAEFVNTIKNRFNQQVIGFN